MTSKCAPAQVGTELRARGLLGAGTMKRWLSTLMVLLTVAACSSGSGSGQTAVDGGDGGVALQRLG